jgi:hypothetical protein
MDDKTPPFITWRYAVSLLLLAGIVYGVMELTGLSGRFVLYCLLPGALVLGGLGVLGHTLGREW